MPIIPPRTGKTLPEMVSVKGIPNPEPNTNSTPPAEIARQWEVLEEIHKDVRAILVQVDQHGERIDQHDAELRELREGHTLHREMRVDLREQGQILGQLSRDIGQIIRSDATQTVDLAKLKAEVVAKVQADVEKTAEDAGHTAGMVAGRIWGVASAMAVVIALSILAWGLTKAGIEVPSFSAPPVTATSR